jgi:serine/threonine protein kinase
MQDVECNEELGSGATATVYGGSMHTLKVAVKVFTSEHVEAWQNEVRANAIIDECARMCAIEPPIVRMIRPYGWLSYQDKVPTMQPAIIYHKYGSDLSTLIQHQSREFNCGLPLVNVFQIGLDIARALEFLHSIGIIHTDVKTGNILLEHTCGDPEPERFRARLCDLGTAALPGRAQERNVGTVEYCAPELIGAQPYTTACDIWAFACMLFRITTLVHLFDVYNEDSDSMCPHVPAPADDSASGESSPPVRYRHLALIYGLIGPAPKCFVRRQREYFTTRGQPIDHPDCETTTIEARCATFDVPAIVPILKQCIRWRAEDRLTAKQLVQLLDTQ